MKRMFAVLLCCALMAAGVAVASDTEDFQYSGILDSNILFRDIPWGETLPYVRKYLNKNDGITGFYATENRGMSSSDIICGANSGYDIGYGYSFEGNLGYTDSINFKIGEDKGKMVVAGYNVSHIYMFYCFMENDDGTFEKSPNYAHLYGAMYMFESENVLSQYADLEKKLINVYGDYSFKADSGDEIFGNSKYGSIGYLDRAIEYTIWYDSENKVMLSLKYQDMYDENSYIPDYVEIAYVWLGGDSLLKKAMEVEQQSIAGDSIDGL